jgi:[ribosomal protein S18]-alanine N-acetyltransferase
MTTALPLNLQLCAIGPFDLDLAAAVHGASFEEAWSAKTMAELLAMPGSFGFIALADGEPAGLVIVLATGPEAEILSLGVVPTLRRRGIARQLFEAAAGRLAAQGVARLYLEVAEDNLSARALYRSLGFAEHGRRPGYYRRIDGRVAALLLDLTLADAGAGKTESQH